ncbi:Adenylate cyclase [hydrothermal vent metagenome]|uniref:Adenylate cyclase n=1 Tax=hydrothermal vent metagenome TaxID=652676 RepID=A0A1W1D2B8_9ZZZZ
MLLLYFYKVEPFESFSLTFNDVNFRFQDKKPHKDIVFVAVDEKSVNKYGRWPWKREYVAKGLEQLKQADVVLFDMIFSEATTQKEDDILASSLSELDNSVCGFFLRQNATQDITEDQLDILSDSALDFLQSQIQHYKTPHFISAPYAEINILPIMESCSFSGSFSTVRDVDDKIRFYPVAVYFKDFLYPSLAVQGLRAKFNKDIQRFDDKNLILNGYKIPVDHRGFARLNFYPLDSYNIISFLDVATKKIPSSYFKGKIVILGITEVGSGDIANTPIGAIPGPLLHYTFLSNFLDGYLIKPSSYYVTPALIIFMVLLPFILVLLVKRIIYRVFINISIYLVVYFIVRYLFLHFMLYIDLFYPLLSLIISLVAVEVIAFKFQEEHGKFIQGAFSSYLSKDLLEQLMKNPDHLKLGGEKKELTILFSDIRSFTSISESMDPEKLIQLLNRYFTPMTNAVLENKGMVDKYIGDAVMAFFNAPVDVKNHADAACNTALLMIKRLEKLNKEFKKEGIKPLRIGIGINTAEVVVGNMGSDTRFNYTVIGDGVNLASRVEGLTKTYGKEGSGVGVSILITEFTVKQLQGNFLYREIEPVKVKGKDKAVLLYELLSNDTISKEIKNLYDEALSKYKADDFEGAEKLFSLLIEKYDDNPSKYFLPKVQQKSPWGIHKMTTK